METVEVRAHRLSKLHGLLESMLAGKLDIASLEGDANAADSDMLGEIEAMVVIFAKEYADAMQQSESASKERSRIIDEQQATISDLMTPILEVWDDVLALPIVGTVDSARATEMTERLLARITQTRARAVIVDVTGVDVVDTMTAQHLVRMVRAARMLGSECTITGLSPVVAQTLIELEVNLDDVVTLRSLRDGLVAATRKRKVESAS